MRVTIWVDPLCPWCWLTTRWLVDVAPARDLVLEWRPMSLLMKNGGLEKADPRYREPLIASHGMLRIAQRIAAGDGDTRELLWRFYAEVGTQIHHDRIPAHQIDLRAVLTALGLDPALADAAGDESLDAGITAAMDDAITRAGEDVGTPIVEIEGAGAFYGPVIGPVPTGDEAARFFDAVATLARFPGMWELKRCRSGAPEPYPVRPQTLVPAPAPV